MRRITRNTGDISRKEMNFLTVAKSQSPASGMANPNFKTVMEMETLAWNIRNFPFGSTQEHKGKMGREIIISVFNDFLPFFE